MKHIALAVIVIFLVIPILAEYGDDPSSYSHVLIPLRSRRTSDPIPGANGSQWTTVLEIANTLPHDVLLNQGTPYCNVGCFTESGFAAVGGRSITEYLLGRIQGYEGAIINVETRYQDAVVFNLRIADVSRSNENLGTDIPVVRESEFLHATTQLLDVPVRSDARVTLRLYDMTEQLAPAFRVRFLGQRSDNVLAERTVVLQQGLEADNPAFPRLPGYAVLFNLEQVPELAGAGMIRIEITPLALPASFWVMASVTNDETQMTTIVAPH